MSRRALWFSFLIAVMFTVCVVQSAPVMAEGPFKIGAAMRSQTQERWIFDVASMQAQADEYGDELLVQWAADDAVKQQQQVENLITQGIDALILAPVNDVSAPSMVEAAKEAGIPVIGYDAIIYNADIDYGLQRDAYQAGVWQALGCLEMHPPNAENPPNVVLIKGDVDYVMGQIWSQSHHDMLDPFNENGTINIVAEQWHEEWSGDRALKTAEAALTANDDNIQCFVCANDSMAIGVAQAIKAAGLEGKAYLSGIDAQIPNLRLIVEDVQTISIWTMIDQMGKRAVVAAHDLAAGTEPAYDTLMNNDVKDVPMALVEIYPVTKDDMCAWVSEVAPAGWAKASDIWVDVPMPSYCNAE